MHHFPLFSHTKAQQVEALRGCLERYLTRKIGFEAVMRIRCTRGLAIHTFHGNFFVRSTDLLSLPNVNPDAGFAMQIAYEESLTDLKTVCFQAALLYTSSKGERRIRVHTLCLPVVNTLTDVMMSADAQAISGLLVKMAVDRSLTSTLADAREAFINATVDILSAFKLAQNLPPGQVVAPMNLALLPLYINAIMKHVSRGRYFIVFSVIGSLEIGSSPMSNIIILWDRQIIMHLNICATGIRVIVVCVLNSRFFKFLADRLPDGHEYSPG